MTREEAASAINTFSLAGGVIAFVFSQLLIVDTAVVSALHVLMIWYIGKRCKADLTIQNAFAMFSTLVGSVIGDYLKSLIIKWIPFIGNFANAAVVYGTTQTIGWAAYYYFKE